MRAPYEIAHAPAVERRLGEAVSAVFEEATAEDPCAAIGWHLVAEPPLALTAGEEESAADDWSLISWLQGVGVHRAVAAAILRPLSGDTSSKAVLERLKGRTAETKHPLLRVPDPGGSRNDDMRSQLLRSPAIQYHAEQRRRTKEGRRPH